MAQSGPIHGVSAASADVENTRRFYEIEAERYARQTQLADVSELRSRFLGEVSEDGSLLDVGCGSGRDLRAFRLLGFRAVGLEPSEPLAKIARAYSGCEVRVGAAENMSYSAEFDGIWACASLLHLPRQVLPTALERIRAAAKPGAVSFLSMQVGSGEFVAPDGRFYALYQPEALELAITASGFELMDVWESPDSLAKRPIRWINLLARVHL